MPRNIPDDMGVGYECEEGHLNTQHDYRQLAEEGKRARCGEDDCDALVTRKLVPLYECGDCENIWAYTGEAERPTCPNCRGKRTFPVTDD